MTEPADYVTLGQMPKRMGVGINSGRKALQEMRKHPRFPPPTIGGKYFWPSVVDFLQFWNGRTVASAGNPAGQENETPYRGRAWANLEAAKKRLAERMEEYRLKQEAGRIAADQSPAVLSTTSARRPETAPISRLGAEAPEQDRARYGYTDRNGNFRRIVAGIGAGKVRVTAPDGRKWIEDAEPTDPASWQRKRKFKPRKRAAPEQHDESSS